MREFVRKAVAFRADHPVLRQPLPLRMADYRASGMPDISYHSQIAWMSQSGQTKTGLGVMYSGAYGKKQDGTEDDSLYIIYNMYWMPQKFALPDLPAGSCWAISADTSAPEGFLERPVRPSPGDEAAKCLQVPPRTVMILTAVSTDAFPQINDTEQKDTETTAAARSVKDRTTEERKLGNASTGPSENHIQA